jgi:hypothetical protein
LATEAGDDGGTGSSSEENTVWELGASRTQKKLLESDCTLVNSLTPEDITDITTKLSEKLPPQEPPEFTHNSTECLKVFNLLKAGVEYYPVSAPVLKCSSYIPIRIASRLLFQNHGRVFSQASMHRLERVPPNFYVPLDIFPTGDVSRSGIDMTYGWWKQMPTLRMTNSKREVSIEYEFGLWAKDILPGGALL